MEGRVTFSDKVTEIKERSGIVDFQAFRGTKDEYIVKELVILDLKTYAIYPFLFKPPFPFNKLNSKCKRTNNWMVRYFHNIKWNEGFTSLKDLENIMFHYCSKFTKIYTRGLEKKNWIQLYTTSEVIDVKMDKTFDYEIDNICILTKNTKHAQLQCAIKNAYRLAAFLQLSTTDSGGGNGGYIKEECEETYHQYYSRLREENTYEDGNTRVSTITS